MGLFTRNKQDLTEIYQQVVKIISDINILNNRLSIMETNMASMRGLINKKLGKGTIKEEEEDIQPMTTQEIQREIQRALLGMPNGKE